MIFFYMDMIIRNNNYFLAGTTKFLLESNPEFVEDSGVQNEVLCNKDTGGLKTLHFRSRGVFFIVSAAGHIEYWQLLYK